MGLNYYMIVSTLFEFRNRLEEFSTPRNLLVIKYFKETAYDPYDEDAHAPRLKEIAEATGIPTPKVNVMVKDLYFKLVGSLYDKPVQIPKAIVTVLICIPWDEGKKPEGRHRYDHRVDEKQLQIDVTLPCIPRIGEQISLGFIENSSRYTNGHIYNISHELTGAQQRIILWVHPYHNYYYEWMKLKKGYEEHERWVKWMESEVRREAPNRNLGRK